MKNIFINESFFKEYKELKLNKKMGKKYADEVMGDELKEVKRVIKGYLKPPMNNILLGIGMAVYSILNDKSFMMFCSLISGGIGTYQIKDNMKGIIETQSEITKLKRYRKELINDYLVSEANKKSLIK